MLEGLENIPVKIDHETGEEVFVLDCIVDARRRPDCQKEEDESEEEDTNSTSTKTSNLIASPVDEIQNEGETGDDGLVRDEWRLISAVKTWPTTAFFLPQCVDYGHNYGKVLRQAISLINEKKPDLTWDHSDSSRDIAGHVENARWESSKDIPPGVNATLVVDPEFDSRAAIGLTNERLRNGSIGFTMELRKSHPKMEFGEFVEKQGQVVDDDEVRWIPKTIKDVRHMALVPSGAGADPNAGRRISATTAKVQDQHIGGLPMINEYVALLSQLCERMNLNVVLDENHPIPEALPEKMLAHLDKYEGVYEKHNDLVLRLANLAELYFTDEEGNTLAVTEMVAQLSGKLDLATQADVIIRHQRKEALRLFDLAKLEHDKDEFTPSERRIRDRIESSMDLEYLADMIDEYAPAAERKFERRTSIEEEPPIDAPKSEEIDRHDQDIRESSKRLFNKKENK